MIAADVATTLAPDTTMPASVSFWMVMNTSLTWSGGFMRSTGGLTMAWFMNSTWFCERAYQFLALSANFS